MVFHEEADSDCSMPWWGGNTVSTGLSGEDCPARHVLAEQSCTDELLPLGPNLFISEAQERTAPAVGCVTVGEATPEKIPCTGLDSVSFSPTLPRHAISKPQMS